ncbi:cyclopropane-fatty-acyl-phospholipid synthase family protein [Sporomusa aerivorans]|uniref:SAM-dependent methyltransferase n=1 Tax=Sporomusa aerivorans TaxID=204936 RepID=UPI00352B602A
MTHEELGDNKSYSLAGTNQEVRFITDVLNLKPGQSILDLYCGYGRHAIELAKQGLKVTGVDATQDFLDIAVQKAQEANVTITFEQKDMRELDYDRQFSAIINMFAAFGYFTDEENAGIVKLVAKALQPKGLFLIDLLNRDWMVRNNLNRYWRHPSGEYVLSYKIQLENGIATMKRQLINQITGSKVQYEFVLRAYSLPEMKDIFTSSGLSIVETFGGFDGRPYSSDTPRMIILAKKNN